MDTAPVEASPPPPTRPGNPDVWVVVAAYNEGKRLGETLRRLCERYQNVVVVDDGSKDDTREVALHHRVWALRHLINCGQGAALQTGIDFALARGAQVLVTFDADGQHRLDDIERLVEPVQAGRVEVALGSRFLGGSVDMPRSRWLVLKLGVLFTRLFSRIKVSDTHNGFRALSRRAAQTIRITQNRMAHASEILDQIRQHDLSFCEVPVVIRYTEDTLAKGQSSWNSLKIVAELLLGRWVR
ncbi:MAG: glycosyltransferase family 2 protein [Planctomycetes bacterium]|nr:glycosyltransferase family 2 protein [Planctomycetota bacterium]